MSESRIFLLLERLSYLGLKKTPRLGFSTAITSTLWTLPYSQYTYTIYTHKKTTGRSLKIDLVSHPDEGGCVNEYVDLSMWKCLVNIFPLRKRRFLKKRLEK